MKKKPPPPKPPAAPAPAGPWRTPAELAAMLTQAGLGPITADVIAADVAAGLPTSADGKIHVAQYAAWLNGAGRGA